MTTNQGHIPEQFATSIHGHAPNGEANQTPGMNRLRELNGELHMLLSDSHPGMPTWHKAMSDTLTEMADFTAYTLALRASHDKLRDATKHAERALRGLLKSRGQDARTDAGMARCAVSDALKEAPA